MSDAKATLATEQPPVSPTSDAALRIRGYIEGRIKAHHKDLEMPGLPIARTDQIRGAIEELRRLYRVITPEMATEGTSSTY